MTPIPELRQIAQAMLKPHAGAVDDKFFETFKPKVVIAMCDTIEAQAARIVELEAAIGAVKPSKAKIDYSPEFLEAMGAMERVGLKWLGGSTLPGAFNAWNARKKSGATPVEMMQGADKYARFCKATDRRVMMAQTFFGPQEFFSADWTITKADARKGQIHGSIGKQDFSAGVRSDGSF